MWGGSARAGEAVEGWHLVWGGRATAERVAVGVWREYRSWGGS